MQPSLPRLAFLAVLALLVTVTSGAGAQTPTPLPPLPGDAASEGWGINDWGEVAGNSVEHQLSGQILIFTAAVWNRSGTPTALPPPDGLTESRVGTGNAINNHGHVVGMSIRGGGNPDRAIVWDRKGTIMRVLPPLPGDTDSQAFAISAHGRVTGLSLGSDGSQTAVVGPQQ